MNYPCILAGYPNGNEIHPYVFLVRAQRKGKTKSGGDILDSTHVREM